MQTWHLYRSNKSGKKYYAVRIANGEEIGRRIYFGAAGYSDFTRHKDINRRDRYDTRHATSENWKSPNTAGFWAKWILWNKPTIRGSIIDTQRHFGIKIINLTAR